MVSTKLLRLPTRGALGNGLRVVAGAVLASEGTLVVITRNRRIELRPERDGTTTVVSAKPVKLPVGTRIEIGFGPALPEDYDALDWARTAIKMQAGTTYAGKLVAIVVRRPAVPRTAVGQRQRAGARTGRCTSTAALAARLARSSPRPGSTARCAGTSRSDQAAKLLLAARESARAGNAGAARQPSARNSSRSRLRQRVRHRAVRRS